VFPPGSRRVNVRRGAPAGGDELPDAFIPPDAPFPERRDGMADDAFIGPDDPIPHRSAPWAASVPDEEIDEESVVVTGIGDDAHLTPEELAHGGDPDLWELIHQVGKLAEALKRRGEAGLQVTPDMSRFEATLRAYCVGFLVGRRAEGREE
jgi:hypothetical protein